MKVKGDEGTFNYIPIPIYYKKKNQNTVFKLYEILHIQDENFTKNRMQTTDVQNVRSKLNPRLYVQQTLLLIKRFFYLQYSI